MENKPTKKVTIITPCRNEEGYILNFLDDVIRQDYPLELLEIMIVDGNSTDKTIQIIEPYLFKYKNIRLITNEKQTVPFALNLGIKQTIGDVVIRMDAHCRYPSNYVSRLVFCLYDLNADNVGGVWDTKPGADTIEAEAIAIATAHPVGIGNAQYRLGNSAIKEADTVPFGCYKRAVFDKIGLFDETLIRNQDDEFNGRLIKNGGKIYLIPDVIITYYARPTLKKIALTYFQYGYFKPLVNKKLGYPATWRQLVPPGFPLSLAFWGLCTIIYNKLAIILTLEIAVYLALIKISSIMINSRGTQKKVMYVFFTFITLHFSYGYGYLKGIWDFIILRKGSVKVASSR